MDPENTTLDGSLVVTERKTAPPFSSDYLRCLPLNYFLGIVRLILRHCKPTIRVSLLIAIPDFYAEKLQ